MSRNLTVADYGTLASITSLIGFPSLILSALTPLVVSFSGEYFAKGKLAEIRGFYIKIFKFFASSGLFIFLLFLYFTPNLASFFHIENKIILLLANFVIFLSFVQIINLALLQAKLAFGYQVFLNFIGALAKLTLGVAFVFMGFSVTGAISAIIIGSLILYILSFLPIRFIFNKKLIAQSSINTRELFNYGIPSALTLLGLTSFISTDVILVKHFFDPKSAGIYAGLSLMGRVIFFITVPIIGVMFPVIVQKHSRNENFNNTFKLSLLLVLCPCIIVTIFYYLFPAFSILFFLKKTEYLSVAPILGFFALFISIYCLLFMISNFYLSIKKTNVYIPILLGAILQIILITFYHQTFMQIILISCAITFLLVLSLLLYYLYGSKEKL